MADWTKKSPVFDFQRGEFAMIGGRIRMARGQERVKNQIEKIIRTELNRYAIYDDVQYGVRIEDLIIGKTYNRNFATTEIQREITDALMKNNEITAVDNFSVNVVDNVLNVEFYVTTVFGDVEVSV